MHAVQFVLLGCEVVLRENCDDENEIVVDKVWQVLLEQGLLQYSVSVLRDCADAGASGPGA